MNVWRICVLYIICIIQFINLVINAEDESWSDWSPCTKSCNFGTRNRNRKNNNMESETETQYCNPGFCPDIIKTCNSSSRTECYSTTGSYGECVNGTCQCTLSGFGSGYGYNKYNCFLEYGNCIMRTDPPTALGYRDPQQSTSSSYKLHSCTTGDNKINEVHIIGIYGDKTYDKYKVTILPRGSVTKPIVLVLTSFEQTNWIINSSVDLAEVIYGGYYGTYSTVVYNSSFSCTYPTPKLRTDLKYGYGSDSGGGNTLQLLKTIGEEFGPITSFTGYYEINIYPFANIILKVGGDPLSLTPKEYMYDFSMVECNPWFPKCKFPYTASDQTWSQWSPCSKSCGIGLRTREICNSTGYLIKKEEKFCNMQYCPDIMKTCNSSSRTECYSATEGNAECVNGTCQCTLSGSGSGYGYNKYNCFPEYGNCLIRTEPPTALGYRDYQQKPQYYYKLHSCTTDDNKINEVHIIGIYGDTVYKNYRVTILPRGPVTKPIVLVLTSYASTNWIINSSVDLAEVLYGGYNIGSTTVSYSSTHNCFNPVPKPRADLKPGYGSDTGGGKTLHLLKTIGQEFGPITSFTGYYEINVLPMARIFLKVGGDPFFVIPKDYIYNLSLVECNPFRSGCNKLYQSSDQSWGQWSQCSKSCDLGTRVREICNSTGDIIQKEEEYCNMQICPDSVTYECTTQLDCNVGLECISSKCRCNKGNHYNAFSCYPEYGNCFIRRNPPTFLGYKDPDMHYKSVEDLYSCTSHGNSRNEIHVIGIFGDRYENEYMISILPRGPITKPIILVLVAYYPTYWKINTTVDLKEVLYGGYRVDSSSVEPTSSSRCFFTAKKRWTLGRYGFGNDLFGGNTVDILKDISEEFGNITSFTGYNELSADPIPHIILKVGGNPLAVMPKNFTYDLTLVNCTAKAVSDPFCKYSNTSNGESWGQWTPCSKSCDIGTRARERCNSTGHLLEKEEEFCNLQYCPDDWIPCYRESSYMCNTFQPFNSKALCFDGKCQCTLGEYYNKNNCFFEFGTCITREHSTTALSYKDPKLYYIHKTSHVSCVSNDNKDREIHVIAITGSFDYNTLELTIIPRGPINKPIIVVLASYIQTQWKINTSVDIEEIVYTGNRHMNTSTLETSGTGNCHFRSTRRYDISSWYGIDSDIIHLLKLTTAEYGPITSFSSFSSINADPYPNVILNVGGNPLAVLPKNFNYNSSENVCTSPAEFRTMCSYKNINQNDQRENTWTEWTKCSKMCNDGTRIREKCNKTGHLLQREEQYCNMEPCKIETKKTCDQWTRFCSFIDSKSDTGICINKTCYCVLGEEYVSNNCYPRYGNCIVKPNPLSALGYRDPSVTYGYPDKTLYSCTTNDNQNYEVHIIAIFRSKSYNNKYRISVIAKDKITKPIVIVLASSDAINWEIHSQVGLHKIIYGGRSKLFSSVNQTSGCSFDVDSKKIDEFGYGEDSQNQETLTLLKTVSSQYGPITSFTGYEYLDTDNDIPRIILNVGGDPLLVPAMDNKFGKTYHNCTSVKPSSNPVTTTTVPTARSGTMTIFPSGKYAIRNQGNFILNCYYLNNGTLTKKHKIILYFEKLLDVSKAFTIIQITYNNSLNLTAIGQVTSNDSGKYTCMEISTGISASVDLLVLNRDLDWSWSEWSTCSKSCGIGIRSRVRYNKNNQEAEIENQYCNLQYCPDVAKKCYSGYCDLDVDSLHCMSGGSMFDNCYPYYDNCIIRENPKVALGYQDVSKSEASNLYSCTTTGNSKNEVHIIGIYGDSINKEYTIDIYLRGPVTKPIILVLTSHHNTYWTINTSVDISKILYYDDDGHPSTVQKLSTSRCGFSAESRKDLYFGFGYDVNGGNTIKTIKAISEKFGTITSFTGYLHLRRTPFSNSSHIILNVGGDPLSVQPQKFKEQGCRPFDIFDETRVVNGFGGIIGLVVLLLSVAVGILVAIGVCCICKQQCFNNNRPMGRYIPPSVPLEVDEQDNVTNTNQEYAISDVAYPSAPPPAYNLENFPPPTETFPDSPPSYETVMRDCQKETHM